MTKSVVTYWNPLNHEYQGKWMPIAGLEGMLDELTLSLDPTTGEYTRLTLFQPVSIPQPWEANITIILKKSLL